LRDQFSIAYDLFLQVLNEVDNRVNNALDRDLKDWRIKNACPSCTYHLEDEPDLQYSMLGCMDGNNSLKRVARTSPGDDNPSASVSIERQDTRVYDNDYYLTRAEVDAFQHEVMRKGTTNNGSEVSFSTY
jgi:hypothetical protein